MNTENNTVIRIWFYKKNQCKYISHLDLNRLMMRALHKSKLPVWSTEGFNPHPFVTFALPLSLGFAGTKESMDVKLLDAEFSFKEIIKRLNECLPQGIQVFAVTHAKQKPGKITFAEFNIKIYSDNIDEATLETKIQEFFNLETIIATKKTKSGKLAEFELISEIKFVELNKNEIKITLPGGSGKNVNPNLYIEKLAEFLNSDIYAEITRINLYDANLNEFA